MERLGFDAGRVARRRRIAEAVAMVLAGQTRNG